MASIEIPESGRRTKTASDKRQARKRFRRRAAIEPIIGHLKSVHSVLRNYLKGQIGDSMNLFMSCAAFNFQKFIRILFFCASNCWGTFFGPMFGQYRLVPDWPFLDFSGLTISNSSKKQGLDTRDALIRAGLTRFRPVLLTAITTILGLLPMPVGVRFDFFQMELVTESESPQWW